MAPKKDKGKKDEEKGGAFNEVEKTFLELQLADSNRKVARLRTAVEEYEVRNEELQKAYDKLDEDRADIIAYLKRMLSIKNEENSELKEKVKGLEEIRDIENQRFLDTTTRLEKDFSIMKDQLTSENKLLAGKLNTLEEFRALRDDLMKKFEKQEKDFHDQEMKYKRIIYNSEKKFIIGKDKLKKEMEARLLQLAQDFQDATELRVAATTHRVIRENIVISNELESILSTQAKLAEQNEKFKEGMKSAQVSRELAEEERDKMISRSLVQVKVIDQLTTAFESVKKEKSLYERRQYDFEMLQAKIQRLTKENDNLSLQVRILEQNLHTRLSDQHKAVADAAKVCKERDKLRKILKEAATAIRAALKLDSWATTDKTREVMDRHVLLSHLLEIISQFREIEQAESLDTIGSFSKIYEEGDLGFVPKPTIKKPGATTLATAAMRIPSKDVIMTETQSQFSVSLSTSSVLSSLKTIPSIKVIPPSTGKKHEVVKKDSIDSFTTSTKSDESTESAETKSKDMDDIEEKLAASKLEVQKSLMKDLALSLNYKSQSQETVEDISKEIEEKQIEEMVAEIEIVSTESQEMSSVESDEKTTSKQEEKSEHDDVTSA